MGDSSHVDKHLGVESLDDILRPPPQLEPRVPA